MENFQVVYRNPSHWDIWQNSKRVYRIKGGPGNYWVSSDNSRRGEPTKTFNSVNTCTNYTCDKLMYELILAKGQRFFEIESWHV